MAGNVGHEARCRICTANDLGALIDSLAEDLWESRRHGSMNDLPWERAGSHWQKIFRELAETAIETLRPAGA